MTDPDRIWLEPEPGSDPDWGRTWARNDVWDNGTEYIRADAIAALSAAEQRGYERGKTEERKRSNATPPEGWKLVPVEPIDAMIDVFKSYGFSYDDAKTAFAELLHEVPEPEVENEN